MNRRIVKLGDICTFKYGQMPHKSDLANEGYPVFSGYRVVGHSSRYHYEHPEIIVVARGVGGTGDVKMSPPQCFLTNLSIAALVKADAGVDKSFLYYRLVSTKLWELRTGTAQAQITIERLQGYQVECPPLSEQRKIVSIIAPYDALIDNNTRRIEILEEMSRMLYREWFVNFRFPAHEKVKMVLTEMGNIPTAWVVLPMSDVVTEIIDYRGKTPKKLGSDWSENGVIALSALNVKQGRLENLDKAKRVDEELYRRWMKSELENGDILMTSEAPLGQLYMLPQKMKYCLSQRLFSIRANPKRILPSLLYMFLGSHAGQEQLTIRSSGTTVLGIRQSELRKVPVLVPPSEVQQRFSDMVLPMLRQIDVLGRKNDNLRKTRDLLLTKLVSGEVSLENLEREAAAQMA